MQAWMMYKIGSIMSIVDLNDIHNWTEKCLMYLGRTDFV